MATFTIMVAGTPDHHSNAKSWCHDHVGRDWWQNEDGRWSWTNIRINQDNNIREVAYQFESKSDAFEFALRWA